MPKRQVKGREPIPNASSASFHLQPFLVKLSSRPSGITTVINHSNKKCTGDRKRRRSCKGPRNFSCFYCLFFLILRQGLKYYVVVSDLEHIMKTRMARNLKMILLLLPLRAGPIGMSHHGFFVLFCFFLFLRGSPG